MAIKPGRRERAARRLLKASVLSHACPKEPGGRPARETTGHYASMWSIVERAKRNPGKLPGRPTNRWERGNRHEVPARWREAEVWWQKRATN